MNFFSASFLKRQLLVALVLCLGLAQSIQLAHRTLHHDVRMLAHTHEAQLAQASDPHLSNAIASTHAHLADCDHGWLSKLFASHEEGDESCRLMAGASGSDVLFSALASIEYAQNAHLFIAFWQTQRAAWAALLREPRGPPALSL